MINTFVIKIPYIAIIALAVSLPSLAVEIENPVQLEDYCHSVATDASEKITGIEHFAEAARMWERTLSKCMKIEGDKLEEKIKNRKVEKSTPAEVTPIPDPVTETHELKPLDQPPVKTYKNHINNRADRVK